MSPHTLLRAAAIVLLALAATIASPAARAITCGRPVQLPPPVPPFSMEVLVDGRALPVYPSGGTDFIEARKGRDYEVRLVNRTGERVAVALAVDGLNSIDARHTSSRDARKWILAPYQTVTLSGWQTGMDTARRFTFTSEANSYGAWLGRTRDLGVITAAFFREARRRDEIDAAPSAPEPFSRSAQENAPSADALKERASGEAKSALKKDELAATGIGREIEHRVVQVDFDEEDLPTSVVSLRYEYHDALVRLGVLPISDDALARRSRAGGFEGSGFAPDPYRDRR